MNTKNISIGVLVAVTLVLSVLVLKQPTVVTVTKTDIKTVEVPVLGKQAAPVVNVPAPIVNVNVPKQTQLGSVSGPDLYSPYWNVNGVREWYYTSGLAQASTTCSFKAPQATTTLIAATIRLDVIASTTVVAIGNATTAYATSTLIMTKNVTGATQDYVAATTTGKVGVNVLADNVVSPNTYINFKVGSGAVAGTNKPAGECKVILREM